MQKVTDHSTQRNLKVKKDAGSSECLCGRWDNHDPDVPLKCDIVASEPYSEAISSVISSLDATSEAAMP